MHAQQKWAAYRSGTHPAAQRWNSLLIPGLLPGSKDSAPASSRGKKGVTYLIKIMKESPIQGGTHL